MMISVEHETLPLEHDPGGALQVSLPDGMKHKPVRDMAVIAVSCSPQGSICHPPRTDERHGQARASQSPSWGAISTEGKANASHQAPISTSVIGEATCPAGC